MRTAILALLLTSLSQAAAPPYRFPRLPIGKDTTFVNGPLDRHGYIDYSAAINARLGKGLKPDDNAAVLLWKTFGPRPEGALVHDDHFIAIGMKRPPEKGDYLVGFRQQFNKDGKLKGAEAEAIYEEQSKASSRPWKAKDFPRIAAWLKANEKPLLTAVEATRRSRYFLPLIPQRTKDGEKGDLIGCLLPSVQRCRELASLLTARAMLHAGEGRDAEAWADLLACFRLGRLVGQGSTLIEALVGFALENLATRATVAYLAKAKPDAKALARITADLAKLPPLTSVADKVDQVERLTFLDSTQWMDRRGLAYLEGLTDGQASPVPATILGGVDYAPAMRVGNGWYDRITAAMRAPTRKERTEKLAALDRDLRSLKAGLTKEGTFRLLFAGSSGRGRYLGDVLTTLLLPAVAKVQDAADRSRQLHDNLRLALAIEAYQRATGSYPRRLSALAPKYIAALPEDVFSGKALIYRRDGDRGYLLYSVGLNGKDDGGKSMWDTPPGDDIAIRMPPKE
jgi:hypothetical protein